MKTQAKLNRIAGENERALAEFGKAVLIQEGENEAFLASHAAYIQAIRERELQEKALRAQIEEIRRNDGLVSDSAMGSVGQASSSAVRCRSCGAAIPSGSSFCPACGASLASEPAAHQLCSTCGTELEDNAAFCRACGECVMNLTQEQ